MYAECREVACALFHAVVGQHVGEVGHIGAGEHLAIEHAVESDLESERSRDSLGGLLLALAFACVCIYAGTLIIDWATDGAVWDIPVPAKVGSVG